MVKIFQLSENLFNIEFESKYLMNMHYWRVFNAKNRSTTLIDFMEKYVELTKSPYFGFTNDYFGFYFDKNIYLDNYVDIVDLNKYDVRVRLIHSILSEITCDYHCIISYKKSGLKLLRHELAHYFFESNNDYREAMLKAIKDIDPSFSKKLFKIMIRAGYTGEKSYISSEIQAFLSTGFDIKHKLDPKQLQKQEKKFSGIFNKFYNKIKFSKTFIRDLQ